MNIQKRRLNKNDVVVADITKTQKIYRQPFWAFEAPPFPPLQDVPAKA
jgi:hypothetical protein